LQYKLASSKGFLEEAHTAELTDWPTDRPTNYMVQSLPMVVESIQLVKKSPASTEQ
jgi:hypothetical protein